MHKDFSPEERLLKLIRSKNPRQASPAAQTDKGKDKIPAQQPKQKISFDLNFILVILLAGLLIYVIPLFLKRPKSAVENLEGKIKLQEGAYVKKAEEPKRPSFDYFSEPVGARNIFSPVLKDETQAQPAVEQGPKLEDLKGQLSLLGVISADPPQVIIEDKRTQKTYFLNKGSTFDDIEVGDILENKVILIYKGKQFELVL